MTRPPSTPHLEVTGHLGKRASEKLEPAEEELSSELSPLTDPREDLPEMFLWSFLPIASVITQCNNT